MVGYARHGKQIPIKEVLDRVPEACGIAEVRTEQMYKEDYVNTAIGSQEWPVLAQRCNELFYEEPELAGIVITHGSAAMEETAYFLNLSVKSDKPVVLTASIRPVTALSTDVDINLLDAIRIAASPKSRKKGVLCVLNNEISAAREVRKCNTFRIESFAPNDLGFLGYVDSDGEVVFYRTVTRQHTFQTEFDVSSIHDLPRVEIKV